MRLATKATVTMPTGIKLPTSIFHRASAIIQLWRLAGAVVLFTTAAARGGSGVWTADASGSWSDTNKWASWIVADGAGNTADFSTVNITANRTVTLNGDRTIGIVQFKDTSGSSTWTLSGSFTLTLDNRTNAPKVRALAQTSYINVILAGTNGVAAPDQTGTAVFNASNTYTGQTAIFQGTLKIGNTNALPGGSRTGDVVMYSGGNAGNFPQLDLDVFSITINGLSSTVSNTTSTTLPKVTSLSGTAGTSTLTLGDNSASGSYNGTIANGASRTVALRKIGNGTQILNGANNYSGGTTIDGGTLVLNGANSGAGAMQINNSGRLAGSGSISAAVTVAAGGSISPGNGAGTLTLGGGLNVNWSGVCVWELAANSTNNPGTDFDQIVLPGGALTLDDGSRLSLRFVGTATAPDATNAFWQSARTWRIVSLSGGSNPGYSCFWTIDNGSCAAGNFSTALDASGGIMLTFTPAGPVTNALDVTRAGSRAIPTGVRGQNPYRTANSDGVAAMFSMSGPSLMRGPAGGLDADTYDWRVYNSGSAWGTQLGASLITSLDYLRQCRNTGSTPLFTANIFGGGYTNGYGTWVCQFDNHTNRFNPGGYGTNVVTGTAAQLAADWVRYCNIIVETYRQRQEGLIGSDTNFNAAANAENLRVYNSVKLGGNWGGRDVLLAGGEAAVPKVIWWEVGNEPEVDLGPDSTLVNQHVISDQNVYRDRYRVIANAMKAVDGSIQTGPCITSPANNLWLGRVAEDTSAPLDFVSVHPYMNVFKYIWGNPTNMTATLLDIGRYVDSYAYGAGITLSNYGGATRFGTRPPGWYWTTPLIASEYNPMNWDATWAMKSSMASGLATVETCFRFAHPSQAANAFQSWFGANYWEQPQGYTALVNGFEALQGFAGDLILENASPGPQPVPDFGPPAGPLRVYLTRQTSGTNQLHFWGLNFSESQHLSVSFVLTNLPFMVGQVTRRSFGKPGADNSLTNATGLGWTVQDLTGSVNPSNFALTVDNASLAILTFREAVPANWMGSVTLSVGPQGGGGTSSTNLVLHGSNGIAGAPYYLLASTNLTLPLANWTRLLTNVVGSSGVISNCIPIDPAAATKFYRLRSSN
jgi:autotransporter-associated beta strand protein